jgi:hypothetical protein
MELTSSKNINSNEIHGGPANSLDSTRRDQLRYGSPEYIK